ncbi:glycosyltransferase family 2 protein [Flavobacterium agrisoli]|uniref:Glycosyltransferase n=1 Tax=Flavobacterium agrisoli TaxID=2793066 RepID=A0A934PKZ1_9FLAO|nr:glycosyltransferase [Flavobacterium agrisoli]MBK0368749.1 glycosyltransferase [Flavobacterium agrisoli]
MLSILIPVYNYNAFPLVLELHKQCVATGINFEILVQDDGSIYFDNENNKINEFQNCHFLKSDKNVGRTTTRNKLVNTAAYDWLLFLDADVIPVHQDFVKNYISEFNSNYNVIFGGYQYQKINPDLNSEFRYKYGRKREEKSALERNINPYQFIFSGNFLIQKKTFLETSFKEDKNFYGMDIYFSYQLFIKKIKVLHIENPIYHLGLETNEIYFKKSLKAVESRKKFLVNCEQIEKISPLIKSYNKIKRYHLIPIVTVFFKISEPILKNRILTQNPNLVLFDVYRLGYMCTLK